MNFKKMNGIQRLRFLLNLPQSLRLVWHLMWDNRVPAADKALYALVVLLYLVIPTDLIPDIIPLFGQLDDLTVLLFITDRFIRRIPGNILAEYLAERKEKG